jgi:hypothetical protein
MELPLKRLRPTYLSTLKPTDLTDHVLGRATQVVTR